MQQAQIKKCFYSCAPYSNNNPFALLSSLESQTEKRKNCIAPPAQLQTNAKNFSRTCTRDAEKRKPVKNHGKLSKN